MMSVSRRRPAVTHSAPLTERLQVYPYGTCRNIFCIPLDGSLSSDPVLHFKDLSA